jgi:hypothetical protein
MSVIHHGQYSITVVKVATDQWRADIRRLDSQKIKTFGGGPEQHVVEMHVRFSFDEAVKEAKRAIDGGGMSLK